jgi:hypothetical protein
LIKSNRAFKSAKRSKELARLQKREEKRLRRQGKQETPDSETPTETVDGSPQDQETLGPETESESESESRPEPSETQ